MLIQKTKERVVFLRVFLIIWQLWDPDYCTCCSSSSKAWPLWGWCSGDSCKRMCELSLHFWPATKKSWLSSSPTSFQIAETKPSFLIPRLHQSFPESYREAIPRIPHHLNPLQSGPLICESRRFLFDGGRNIYDAEMMKRFSYMWTKERGWIQTIFWKAAHLNKEQKARQIESCITVYCGIQCMCDSKLINAPV